MQISVISLIIVKLSTPEIDKTMRTLSFTETNPQFGAAILSAKLKWLLVATLSAILFLLATQQANAVPLFARQTGQNCLACHAGGQYPELTPYGRYFKLTGYTQGTRQDIPIAVSFVGGMASSPSGNAASGTNPSNSGAGNSQQNGKFEPDNASVYVGGKIFDNFGAFSQWTYAFDSQSTNGGVNNQNTFGADNQDWRYADHYVGDSSSTVNDIIWGASLNNAPSVTDVWNSAPSWMYPYMPSSRNGGTSGVPVNALLGANGGLRAPGYGGYIYLNKNFYAELEAYQSGGSGPLSWMTYGSTNSNPVNSGNGTPTYLKGLNPYFRLAYQSDEHGPHNWMIGALGMNVAQYGQNANGLAPGSPDLSGGVTQYQDRGVDAQYQYLSNPHTVTVQARYMRENITDNNNIVYGNSTNNLNSITLKASYVYDAKYGVGLGYQNVSGSADGFYGSASYTGAIPAGGPNLNGSQIGSPNSTAWVPSIWWQALQNVRLGLQYTAFTQYMGASKNYDGQGTNASANNTTWLYLWMAM